MIPFFSEYDPRNTRDILSEIIGPFFQPYSEQPFFRIRNRFPGNILFKYRLIQNRLIFFRVKELGSVIEILFNIGFHILIHLVISHFFIIIGIPSALERK